MYSAPEPTNRLEMKLRVDWNLNPNTRVRAAGSRQRGRREPARLVGWSGEAADTVAHQSWRCIVNVAQKGSSRRTKGLRRSAASRLTRIATLRPFADALGADFVGFSRPEPLRAADAHQYLPGGQLGTGAANPDIYAHNDELLADKLTKIHGTHASGRRQRRASAETTDDLQPEDGALFYAPNTPGGTEPDGDLLVGRPFQVEQGTMAKDARFRMWNLDLFAQDSWKIRDNVTLDLGVRAGYWTNNAELGGLGTWFDPTTYDASSGAFLDPEQTRLNGVRYAALGQAPLGLLPNRSPFVMPRASTSAATARAYAAATGVREQAGGQRRLRQRVGSAECITSRRTFRSPLAGRPDVSDGAAHPVGDVIGTQGITTITSGPSRFRRRTATACLTRAGSSGTSRSRARRQ